MRQRKNPIAYLLPLLFLAVILGYYAYAPSIQWYFHHASDSAREVVTLVTDKLGHAFGHAIHQFSYKPDMPHWILTAIVYTNDTRMVDPTLQATLGLTGANFSTDQPNVDRGPDQTVFTWDVSILSVSLGIAKLSADVLVQLVSCGSCTNATFEIPVDLVVAMSA